MSYILQILKYAIGIGLVVWLVRTNQINLNIIQDLMLVTIVSSIVLSFSSLYFATLRLKILLSNQHFNISMFNIYKLNMLGIFYSLFLPGGVSGDVVKGYHLLKYRNDKNSKTNIVTTLFLDRYLGLVSMFILASLVMTLATSAVSTALEYLYYMIVLATAGLIFAPFLVYGVIVFFHNKKLLVKYDYLYSKIMKIEASIHKFIDLKLLIISLLYGIIGHIFSILIIWIISENLQSLIGLFNVLIISPLAFVVNLLPISPGGIGVGEKAFEELFLLYGVTGGATVFFISRFFMYLPGMLGLFVFLQKRVKKDELTK